LRRFKKILIALMLVLLLLLSALYLAVNSPYVIDRIARTIAPEYHFSYDRIRGNPLQGIVLENLYYKKRRLAGEISIRINPYTILEGTVTISRLHLLDVDVGVLEAVIREFGNASGGAAEEEAPGDSGLPVGIEVQNIQLSLLPFHRYGVNVRHEELSVESIYYDGETFAVGRVKQKADTSLGTVELEGTYHERFLDVDMLAVEDLDLTALEQLLGTLETMGADGNATTPSPDAESNTTGTETAQEDLFLPRRIHAKKFWITLKPYRYDSSVTLKWAQLQGQGLDVDLEHSRILDGSLNADLDTDLGQARLQLTIRDGRAILNQGTVSSLDLQKILKLAQSAGTEERASANHPKPATETNATVEAEGYDRYPFVPSYVELHQLRIELKSDSMEGIAYAHPLVKLHNVSVDLHHNRVRAELIGINLDTSLARFDLEAGIDDREIRLRRLDVDDVNLTRLMTLREKANAAPVPKNEEKKAKSGGEKGGASKGFRLPFVPSTVVLERGMLRFDPFEMRSVVLHQADLNLTALRFDLPKFLLRKGTVRIDAGSNLAELKMLARIRDNRLSIDANRSTLRLGKRLFETLGLPVRTEAFSPLHLAGSADEKRVALKLSFEAYQILADRNGTFNVDIPQSVLTARYGLESGELTLHETGSLSVPQAPRIRLALDLKRRKDGRLHYTGRIDAGTLKLGNARIEKMLGSPRLDLSGDMHTLKAKLRAGVFDGRFVSDDLKKGVLTLGTRTPLKPADYIKLPGELSEARVNLRVETPVDFSHPLPITSRLFLHSNLFNVDGTLRYDGNVSAKLLTRFPKDSLLAALDPKLNLQALNPLSVTLKQGGGVWNLGLESKKIRGDIEYVPETEGIKGLLDIAGSRINIEGKAKKLIVATVHSPSIKRMISGVTDLYRVEVPPLDGDIALTLRLNRLSSATLELKSRQFVPDATARIKSPIKNLRILLGADMKKRRLEVKKYTLETAGLKIFSSKPSTVRLDKNRLIFESIWINDSLKLQGYYDLKKARGELTGRAENFKIDHENAKLNARINLKAKIDGEKIDVGGKVTILGGKVSYNLEAKHYASDEDIVILQHQKKGKESFFTKNVQLNLYIDTKKPLLFKQKNVYVELRPQLSIIKGFGADLQMMGSVALAKGGYYIFEGKQFLLQPSSVNFTGKPTRPLLDINLVYRRYGRTVYITVSGLATEPNLNFSSDPYMTRNQILSFILFDTVDSGEDAGDMMSMVGGGIAKSILGNIGLKVDTLIVTSQGFEVGKKITDKITVIYDQKEENPKVVVRVQHSRRTETDISIGSESQSVDIIYKKEF